MKNKKYLFLTLGLFLGACLMGFSIFSITAKGADSTDSANSSGSSEKCQVSPAGGSFPEGTPVHITCSKVKDVSIKWGGGEKTQTINSTDGALEVVVPYISGENSDLNISGSYDSSFLFFFDKTNNFNSSYTFTNDHALTGNESLTIKKTGTGASSAVVWGYDRNNIETVNPINCGSKCSYSYTGSESIEFNLNVDTNGSTFNGWSGCDEIVSGSICRVKIDASVKKTITANFGDSSPNISSSSSLSVSKTGDGASKATVWGYLTTDMSTLPRPINCGSTCSYNYTGSEPAVMYLNVDTGGATFKSWSGCDEIISGSICSVKVSSGIKKTITAIFGDTETIIAPSDSLSVNKIGTGASKATAWGYRTDEMSTFPRPINCGSTCSYHYAGSDTVELFLNVDTGGSTFNGWSGCDKIISGSICSVKVNSSSKKTINAYFGDTKPGTSIGTATTTKKWEYNNENKLLLSPDKGQQIKAGDEITVKWRNSQYAATNYSGEGGYTSIGLEYCPEGDCTNGSVYAGSRSVIEGVGEGVKTQRLKTKYPDASGISGETKLKIPDNMRPGKYRIFMSESYCSGGACMGLVSDNREIEIVWVSGGSYTLESYLSWCNYSCGDGSDKYMVYGFIKTYLMLYDADNNKSIGTVCMLSQDNRKCKWDAKTVQVGLENKTIPPGNYNLNYSWYTMGSSWGKLLMPIKIVE